MSGAFHIWGPRGQKIVVQTPDPPADATALLGADAPAFAEAFDELYLREVNKRVRNRAVSMATVTDRDRGKLKPTPVNYETLRTLGQRNEWARAIINTRKRQITGVDWSITLKDTDDPSGAAAEAARVLTKLLKHPCKGGSRPQSLSWRQWLGMLLEDLMVIDRACIEKEWNGNGWPVALYPVDGATIRPNMDDDGGFYRDAYVQVVDGIKTAEFGMEDLIVGIYNPQTDVKLNGYGISPLESVVISATADLHAARYNSDYFQKGAVPEGILNLGENVDPTDVVAFTQYWLAEIVGKPWTLPIIGGSEKPEFIDWRQSNKDMQFMEYQAWLLQKMCAVFEISKDEVGEIEDVNRSTADSQDSQQNRKGTEPLLAFLKDTFDLEIIGEHGAGLGDFLEFSWEKVGESAEQINQKFGPMHGAGVATGKEWRDAHGMDDPEEGTVGAEGLGMHLTSGGQPVPLPGHADVQHMGAAAERAQAQEDMQQGFERDDMVADRDAQSQGADDGGGEKAGMPWKPADGDSDDVKSAMADHDHKQGIGPRNVAKAHPGGHDRHPALTGKVEDLEGEFSSATDRLLIGLSGIFEA